MRHSPAGTGHCDTRCRMGPWAGGLMWQKCQSGWQPPQCQPMGAEQWHWTCHSGSLCWAAFAPVAAQGGMTRKVWGPRTKLRLTYTNTAVTGQAWVQSDTRLSSEDLSCPAVLPGMVLPECLRLHIQPSSTSIPRSWGKNAKTPHLANDKTTVFHCLKSCDATVKNCTLRRTHQREWLSSPEPSVVSPTPSPFCSSPWHDATSSAWVCHLKACVPSKSCSLFFSLLNIYIWNLNYSLHLPHPNYVEAFFFFNYFNTMTKNTFHTKSHAPTVHKLADLK